MKLTPSQNENRQRIQTELSSGVGLYRAEYLSERIFDLFTPPPYWDRLKAEQPCFLIGGRGTGKTTSLRALAFDGQLELQGDDISQWATIGFYWRVETNAVTAFKGERLREQDWIRLFSHFVNLQLVRMVLEFVTWREALLGDVTTAEPKLVRRAALALGLDSVTDLSALEESVGDELAQFESTINGLVELGPNTNLSMLGKPVEYLLDALRVDPTIGGHYYTFCIDEYENFEDYQQLVMNTLIKHVGDSKYTFKIGMRETGLRVRQTLNAHERLIEPADFVSIDIIEALKDDGFSEFAKLVCTARLSGLLSPTHELAGPDGLFPEISIEDEAHLLGVDSRNAELRASLKAQGASGPELATFDQMSPMGRYLVDYWSRSKEITHLSALKVADSDPTDWKIRLGNYSYAMLFTIRRGKSGTKKYYTGWSTLVHLADGNIRFLLNLVTVALESHLIKEGGLTGSVAPSVQTSAATTVGQTTLHELQGLDVRGAQMTRFVLGMGRIFGVLAADPYGHTPEVAQFRIQNADTAIDDEVNGILNSSIMHSCLKRFTSDKMALVSAETKGFDYQLHPIFAPFFLFSPRSKRRLTLKGQDILDLSSLTSKDAIARILRAHDRIPEPELPEQLTLFSEHFQ